MADTPVLEPHRIEVSTETTLSPKGVVCNLVGFAHRRLEVWPSLDPRRYRVHQVGDEPAIANEHSVEPDPDRHPNEPEYEPLFENLRADSAAVVRTHSSAIWDGLIERD